MTCRTVTILDGERNPVATASVEFREGHYSGAVNLDRMPGPLRELFDEYEEIVDGQVFSLLDQIEDRVGAIPFSVVLDDGRESRAEDIQIFPRVGTISFKVAEPALLGGSR